MKLPKPPPNVETVIKARSAELPVIYQPEYQAFFRRDRYLPWDKFYFAATAAGLDAELAWVAVKFNRIQQYRTLPLKGHGGTPLKYNVPPFAQQELMLIDKDQGGQIGRDDETPSPAWKQERFVMGALQEEAIASSLLEGAATTRAEAKRLLRSGRKPKTIGEKMVVNNYQAMLAIRDSKNIDLSPEFLLEIQRLLTADTLDEPSHVGRFRTDADDIKVIDARDNVVLHTPPPHAELAGRLKEFCQFANQPHDHHTFIHPVLKACVLHFQIGFDHPFCDGNGRTARAIFYWYLLREGYWLFEYLPISPLYNRSPAKYAKAYLHSEFDDFDITHFLMYNLKVISHAREQLGEYVQKKQAQVGLAHRLFHSDLTLNHRQREVLLNMARNPDWTIEIATHMRTHAVAYGTARHDLLDLAEKGYLTRRKRANAFVFLQGKRMKESGDHLA